MFPSKKKFILITHVVLYKKVINVFNVLFYESSWNLVRNWLGFYLVDPSVISDQFIQFGNLLGFSHARRFLMLIWKEKNSRIF